MGKISIDVTIGGNTQRVNFTTATPQEEAAAAYYVGWADMTAEWFRDLTDYQIAEMATRQDKKEWSGTFGKNSVFFLLYQEGKQPTVTLISSGVPMEQDLVDDSTCPHDDVTLNGTTYKVFGMRFYQPNENDTITIKY